MLIKLSRLYLYILAHVLTLPNMKQRKREVMNSSGSKEGRYISGWKEERERGNNVIIIKKLNARLEKCSVVNICYIHIKTFLHIQEYMESSNPC